ncbi:DUF3164 family protein [Chryseobacterium sp. CCH4-E10]|uniref:DUF3164 family protein n=1 Tax=Chryseobacterium sp. CCH4-E10 TaxID=1768758 RepID=UPI00082E46CC|nr:DUF3164 family protein [Chryseobacterium sp. CCH4-E10]
MTAIDLNSLSPDQIKEILKQVSPEELKNTLQEKENQKEKDRKAYKELVNSSVPTLVGALAAVSEELSILKLDIFEGLKTLLDLKQDAYQVKQGQQTHTFTDDQGNGITYGFRVVDGWDDTVNAGIDKIKEVIESMAKDENSAKLVSTVNKLLKKDAKGQLKSSRVLELRQLAEEFNDDQFSDAVKIIQDAYKPVRSAFFIEAYTTNAQGKKVHIPLSITSVDFPDGTEIEDLFPISPEE